MAGGLHPPPEVIAEFLAKANYVNPQTRGEAIAIMEIVLTVACYIVVALRVYARARGAKSFGIDDALIVFNLIPLTGMAVAISLALTRYGWNRHIWDIPLDMLYQARKVTLSIQILYLTSTATTKISILLFYRRLTLHVSQPFLWAIYFTIFTVVGFWLSCIVGVFAGCRPFESYWLQVNPFWLAQNKYSCIDEASFIIAAAIISMVQDFMVCILPMLLFLRLNIKFRQKVALTVIFGIGLFLCVCGVLRMVKIIRTYYGTYDITWSSVPVWIWTGIEAHVAIIIASIPALNHFFRKIFAETSISSRLYRFTTKRQPSSDGYDRTGSRSNSDVAEQPVKSYEVHKKGSIHITKEIRLDEFLRDKRFDEDSERGGRDHSIEERPPPPVRRAWLDDDTSDDDRFEFRAH